MDKIFGIHSDALQLRAKRAQYLASNIANQDTPNFKAKDLDFNSILNKVNRDESYNSLATTNSLHISDKNVAYRDDVIIRKPLQTRPDGNTVDSQKEMADFAKNSMDYLASLRFLNGKIKTLMTAIRGE